MMTDLPFKGFALQHLPTPATRNIALRVTPEAERALINRHPWLFDQAITHQSHTGQPGDIAVVFDSKRKFLAAGLYDPWAAIRVRVLQHGKPVDIDQGFYENRLASAARLRSPLHEQPEDNATTGYRLVHGENDGMPGLVIDRYGDTLVIKLYTPAWIPHLKNVLPALNAVHHSERLVLRLSREMMDMPQYLYDLYDGQVLYGPAVDGPTFFYENGLLFEADLLRGQKTGFFFDQRDNRSRVEKLAKGKAVLNVFAYTGGFSVYAGRGGARKIFSIDSSLPALQAAERNMSYNLMDQTAVGLQHEIIARDAFQALAQLREEGKRFDMVIIDPPAFARKQTQVGQALSAYERLTEMGLGVLLPGGILVQASCSSRVGAEEFFQIVHLAALRAGRELKDIERSGHALDHPVTFREGAYLKCLFATAP